LIAGYNEQLRASTPQPYRRNDQSQLHSKFLRFRARLKLPCVSRSNGPLLLNLQVPFFGGACFSLALAPSAQVDNIPPPPLSMVAHHSTPLLDTGCLFSLAPQMDPTPPRAIRTILRPTKMSLLVELTELALKSTRQLRTIRRFCLLIR